MRAIDGPHIVANELEMLFRKSALRKLRKILRNLGDLDRWKLSGQYKELATPLYKVSLYGYVCFVSYGVIADWRRERITFEILEKPSRRRPPQIKLAFTDKLDYFGNRIQKGLAIAAKGYRESLLEEPGRVPENQKKRGRFFAEHFTSSASFFYRWLIEGNFMAAVKKSYALTVLNACLPLLEERPPKYRKKYWKNIPKVSADYHKGKLYVIRNGIEVFSGEFVPTPAVRLLRLRLGLDKKRRLKKFRIRKG